VRTLFVLEKADKDNQRTFLTGGEPKGLANGKREKETRRGRASNEINPTSSGLRSLTHSTKGIRKIRTTISASLKEGRGRVAYDRIGGGKDSAG